LHYVDKLTSKKYAKTINLICAGNKLFVKYQTRGGWPPLRTALIISVILSRSRRGTIYETETRILFGSAIIFPKFYQDKVEHTFRTFNFVEIRWFLPNSFFMRDQTNPEVVELLQIGQKKSMKSKFFW